MTKMNNIPFNVKMVDMNYRQKSPIDKGIERQYDTLENYLQGITFQTRVTLG